MCKACAPRCKWKEFLYIFCIVNNIQRLSCNHHMQVVNGAFIQESVYLS